MLTRIVNLTANVPKQETQGGSLVVIEGITAGAVSLSWIGQDGNIRGTIAEVASGRKYRPGFEFSGVELIGSSNATVTLLIGGAGSDADLADSTVIITNTDSAPVPVEIVGVTITDDRLDVNIGGGTVEVTAGAVEVLQADTIAATSVAATDTIAALLAANADRSGFYARNAGADPVALVPSGGTYANAAIILQPGETWKEDIAPRAAWYCICDTGETATVKVLAGTW